MKERRLRMNWNSCENGVGVGSGGFSKELACVCLKE